MSTSVNLPYSVHKYAKNIVDAVENERADDHEFSDAARAVDMIANLTYLGLSRDVTDKLYQHANKCSFTFPMNRESMRMLSMASFITDNSRITMSSRKLTNFVRIILKMKETPAYCIQSRDRVY